MKTSKLILAAAIILSLIFVAIPMVSARGTDISEIQSGDTVFVFEQGLEISSLWGTFSASTGTGGDCNPAIDCTFPSGVNFTATPAGAVVSFTGYTNSALTPGQWKWTFGDGGTSTDQNPSHTYTGTVGSPYTVTLTVNSTDPRDPANVSTKTGFVDVTSSIFPGPYSLQKFVGDDTSNGIDNIVPVDNPISFDVLDGSFIGYYGFYYPVHGGTVDLTKSIRVKMPSVTLDVVLEDSKYDFVNGETVTRSTMLAFKVVSTDVGATYRTTPDDITQRAKVDIEVKTAGGATLTNFGGQNLKDIPVTGVQFYKENIDISTAEAGLYTATVKWASPVGFVNQAPDSNKVSFTVTSKSLTITSNKETVVKGSSFTVTVTGESRKNYYLFIKDAGSGGYPDLLTGQTDVNEIFIAGNGSVDVPGTSAIVKTDSGGSITVQYNTDNADDDQDYTIEAIDLSDSSKYDTVDVSVQAGEITLTMGGSGTYYMGDVINLQGTNTESDFVYLFVTGPNLNSNGVRIDQPGVACSNGDENTFKKVDVDADNAWKYKWDTSQFATVLDPGTYTVYAVGVPKGRNGLSGETYETASITLKKGYISVQLSSNSVASGDKFYVRGTASGNPDRVYVWMFGKNYRNMYNAVAVKSDSTFEWKIDDTSDLYAGQYFVIVQHPMTSGAGIYAVDAGGGTCSGLSCSAIKGRTDTWDFGPVRLSGLQAPDAAEALKEALDSPNIDDLYTSVTFTVGNPFITINSIPDHRVNDTITVSGITNLAMGDNIQISVMSSSFSPTQKTQSSEFSGASGIAIVTNNASAAYNQFSLDIDTDGFKQDQYMILAESIDTGTTATINFNLLEYAPTPLPTPVTPLPTPATPLPTPIPTPLPTPPTTEPTPTPTKSPGFGSVIAIVGLCIVGYLVLRKDKQP